MQYTEHHDQDLVQFISVQYRAFRNVNVCTLAEIEIQWSSMRIVLKQHEKPQHSCTKNQHNLTYER